MKVLGIYTSPRKGGNSDILLDEALAGAEEAGAEVQKVVCRKLKVQGCIECGGCDQTGQCVVQDDMQTVYPLLEQADAIVLGAPMFFYNIPAIGKALVDRAQACWSKRMLTKTKEQRKSYDSGKGYFLGVGATKGQNLFAGSDMVMKYFYDALDMSYEGSLGFRGLEGKGQVKDDAEALAKAREFGKAIANSK